MPRIILFLLIFLTISIKNSYAEDINPNPTDNFTKSSELYQLKLSLPLLDYPGGFQNGYSFSARQSLEFTNSFYDLNYFGISKAVDYFVKPEDAFFNTGAKYLASIPLVYFNNSIRFSVTWLHEEYHRAALEAGNVSGHNDPYRGYVDHVNDEDLARLKMASPQKLIRAHAAGMESQNDLTLASEKDDFFLKGKVTKPFYYLLNTFNNAFYMTVPTLDFVDAIVDKEMSKESNSDTRDFTGLDPAAWVYDMFRPNEPYTARGTHPTGKGIKRFIKLSDLTSDEKNYLITQRNLSFLGLIDPMMFLVHSFTLKEFENGEKLLGNANLKYYPTSFGSTINLNMFIKKSEVNLFVSVLNQMNYKSYFPGLDVQLSDYPVKVFDKQIYLGGRAMAWLQPQDQNFKTDKAQFGALGSISLSVPVNDILRVNGEVEAKTAGWVAGNMFLEPNISMRLGVSTYFR
jgi:hypothetical protein